MEIKIYLCLFLLCALLSHGAGKVLNNNTDGDDIAYFPAMKLVYSWKTVDFEFENDDARKRSLSLGSYVPENNCPTGMDVWRDRVFITLPRWKNGTPATLATVPRHSSTKSPKLKPYPNWKWNNLGNCEGLTSVFSIYVDDCMRLWVLDSGKVNVAEKKSEQLCPPALFIFDLRTDTLIHKPGSCNDAEAYISDAAEYGIVVYDLLKDSSFRMEHPFFQQDPLSEKYKIHGVQFEWTDGVFGWALSPPGIDQNRTLFFHPISSSKEFAVSTTVLKDKNTTQKSSNKIVQLGKPRVKDYGQSSGSAIDNNGVMFFNMISKDSVWCWNTRKEYIPENLGVIAASNVSLIYPNEVRVDHEANQNVWILSDKLPTFLYGHLNSNEVNFRVFRANVRDAVRGTVCDPKYGTKNSVKQAS